MKERQRIGLSTIRQIQFFCIDGITSFDCQQIEISGNLILNSYTFLMIGFIALIFWIGSNSKSMYGDEIHEEILEELKDLQKTDANGKKGEQATDEKSGAKEGDEKYGKNGELRQRKNDDKELSPEMEAAMGGLGMKNKKKS